MSTRSLLGLASVVLLLGTTTGCKSASKTAHNAAEAMSSGYNATMKAGRAVVDMLPGQDPTNPGEARERMLGQAGQNRFRNEAFHQAREGLTPQVTAFSDTKEQLRSERFEESREGFRNAEAPGFTGSLGKAMGVAVQNGLGVNQPAAHPVLGATIPGFGGPAQGRNRPD